MRGIYLLPNLFTAANLACGYCAILKATSGDPHGLQQAGWLILLANIFDILDGRVARWTKATSKFGVEFDSLADLVAFGVAPAVLLFKHSLHTISFWGATVSFAFVLCGAARLARFNVQAATETGGPSYFFVGCPIPAASSMLAGCVLFDLNRSLGTSASTFFAITLVGALTMVSTVPYPSMKKTRSPGSRRAVPVGVLFFVLFVGGLVTYSELVIFFLVFSYFLSGPAWKFGRFLRRLTGTVPAPLIESEASDVELKENQS